MDTGQRPIGDDQDGGEQKAQATGMNQRLKQAPLHLSRRSALLMPLALGGCGMFDWLTDDAKPPIHGNREPILSPARGLAVDAASTIELPPVVTNAEWAQPDNGPSHVGGNFSGGLAKAWSRNIGAEGDYRARFTAQPIIAGGHVYTMDTDGRIRAWDLSSGAALWDTRTKPKKNKSGNIGGGISYADGRIYAATGRAEALALDAGTGHIIWRREIDAPARSAPTIVGNMLYFCTLDQKMVAMTTAGVQLWAYTATRADTGVLAQASPAYSDGLLVAGFESGDLACVHADNGTLAWSDNLGTLKGSASLLEFSTVAGAPVVENGIVYAIGLGGLMAALDLRSGRRVWERDIAGGNTPWLAGDTLFIVTAEQKAAAVSKDDGTVHWVTDLPQFENPKRTKGLISWTGTPLIGGKLVTVSTDAHMAILDPTDGKLVSKNEMNAPAALQPVVAQGIMLVLSDDATLTAYK
jgi:outer membrane protein assembly factor BamB